MTRFFDIDIETILQLDPDEFLENATGTINLTLEDNDVLEVDHVSLAWSMFGMHYHRKFGTPVRKEHFINQYFDDVGYRSKSWLNWINRVFWDTYDHVLATERDVDDRILFTELCEDFIYVYGKLYSAFISASREYMLSISLKDCYETFWHPEMVTLRENAKQDPRPSTISKVIDKMKKLVSSPAKIIDNPLTLISRIGCVRIPQVIQCVGIIGFRTEVNGDVFAKPLTETYLEGFSTPYGYMIETRTSCIAQLATYGELRSSEYSARKTQLSLVNIRGIEGNDCGTRLTTDILVQPREVRDHLSELVGTNYLLPDGSYDWIRGNEYHLENTVIKVFTPASCYYPKKKGKVCRKCYGKMAESHHTGLHLGYVSAISSSSGRSQNSMGKKHSIGSAQIVGLYLTPDESKYITQLSTSDYAISAYVVKEKAILKIPAKSAAGLNNVIRDTKLQFTQESVSSLRTIYFEMLDKKTGFVESIPINVALLKNCSYLSYEFISYIRKISSQVTLDEHGYYNVPLEHWDPKAPALSMPAVNKADAVDIDAIYESLDGRLSAMQKRGVINNASNILSHVFELLSPTGTHISDIAITAMSILSEAPERYRFEIGNSGLESVPTPLMERVMGMSAGTAMAFERQHIQGFKVSAMLPYGRVSTPLDVVMLPSILNHNYR